jgi:hypothetical protein
MEKIKSFAVVSIAAILAYFEPIQSVLAAVTWLFVLNFLFGLLAGVIAQKESFNFRKAFVCVSEASVFLLILAVVFYIGDHIGVRTGALQAVSTITYALIYFYAVNIFKNLRQLFPGSKAIAFIHYLISVEVLQKLPHLNRFLSKDYRENPD